MSSNVQIIWKSLRNALNFRSILFLYRDESKSEFAQDAM